MLKIRYNLETGLLSGWTDIKAEFDDLLPMAGHIRRTLDIPKPDVDDYEYFAYKNGKLELSGKEPPEPPRDPLAELDAHEKRISKLEDRQ